MEVLGNENVPPGDTESDEEDQPMATNFRAKPVPEHTNQPVFQNMVREQPKRFVSECEIPLKDFKSNTHCVRCARGNRMHFVRL